MRLYILTVILGLCCASAFGMFIKRGRGYQFPSAAVAADDGSILRWNFVTAADDVPDTSFFSVDNPPGNTGDVQNAVFFSQTNGQTGFFDYDGVDDLIEYTPLDAVFSNAIGTVNIIFRIDGDDNGVHWPWSFGRLADGVNTRVGVFINYSADTYNVFCQKDGVTQWHIQTAANSTDLMAFKWINLAVSHDTTEAAIYLEGVRQDVTTNVSTDVTVWVKSLMEATSPIDNFTSGAWQDGALNTQEYEGDIGYIDIRTNVTTVGQLFTNTVLDGITNIGSRTRAVIANPGLYTAIVFDVMLNGFYNDHSKTLLNRSGGTLPSFITILNNAAFPPNGSAGVDFDGTTESIGYAVTGDVNLSFAGGPCSFEVLVNMDDSTTARFITKSDNTASEWTFGTDASDKFILTLHDASAGASISVTTVAVTGLEGSWIHVVGTSKGTDETGLEIYTNGVLATDARTESGVFVEMEDIGAADAGFNDRDNTFYNGKTAQITIWDIELTAAQVLVNFNAIKGTVGL